MFVIVVVVMASDEVIVEMVIANRQCTPFFAQPPR